MIMGLFALELPHDILRVSMTANPRTEYAVLQPEVEGMEVDTREIRGQRVRILSVSSDGSVVREENLRALAFIFLLLTGIVLLTLKYVSVQCNHTHSHGKVSIVRYIHSQDGQK